MNIFITGTDTEVGKTIISAAIAGVLQSLGFVVGVYKPIQTGAEVDEKGNMYSPDLKFVKNVDTNIITHCSFMYKTPAAPLVAANVVGDLIDINVLVKDYKNLCEQCDFVIVEGIGGISVPIAPGVNVKDLILALDIPVLAVTRPNLGTINHSILTAEYAKAHNLDFIGFIMSGYPILTSEVAVKTAPQVIPQFAKSELLGIIPKIPNLSIKNPQAESLIEAVLQNLDLEKIFQVSLPKLSTL